MLEGNHHSRDDHPILHADDLVCSAVLLRQVGGLAHPGNDVAFDVDGGIVNFVLVCVVGCQGADILHQQEDLVLF